MEKKMKHNLILNCINELETAVNSLGTYVDNLREPIVNEGSEKKTNDEISLENFLEKTPVTIQSITENIKNIKNKLEEIVEDIPKKSNNI